MPANLFYRDFDIETMMPRKASPAEYRTRFQIDRDRIIHSSAFRRLQNKTQVFLSGEYDFYRTRLTHSIEVAQIGRSICAMLQSKHQDLLGDEAWIDPDLVESACLAHDLGHPPFGHTGERTLHALMAPYGGFEGNAQTLRILTQTIFSSGREGMNPTRSLVDGVLKYKTLQAELPEAKNHFLYNDQHTTLTFAHGGEAFPAELTPGKVRNGFHSIECQIMDWADDTAYSLNDLADGIHAGFISLQSLERWAARQSLAAVESEHIDFLCTAIREDRVEARLNRHIGLCIGACSLRSTQGWLSDKTRRYGLELCIDETVRARTKLNKRISNELVFQTPALQQLDHKASFILKRLFGVLHERYIEGKAQGLHMLPEETENAIAQASDSTERARLVCDWIANMTDRFAFRTYRRLFDAEFGSITDLV